MSRASISERWWLESWNVGCNEEGFLAHQTILLADSTSEMSHFFSGRTRSFCLIARLQSFIKPEQPPHWNILVMQKSWLTKVGRILNSNVRTIRVDVENLTQLSPNFRTLPGIFNYDTIILVLIVVPQKHLLFVNLAFHHKNVKQHSEISNYAL